MLSLWFAVYYAVTGRNALSGMVNPDEQITRQEAVRLFTRGNAYQSSQISSFWDYMEVGEKELTEIKSVLTVVDGKNHSQQALDLDFEHLFEAQCHDRIEPRRPMGRIESRAQPAQAPSRWRRADRSRQ